MSPAPLQTPHASALASRPRRRRCHPHRRQRAVTSTLAQGVELVAVAVAIAFRDVIASALVNGALAAAYATGVELAYARIFVVADAIEINVCRTISTTLKQGVKLGAVAVTIPCGNGVHRIGRWLRAVANPASVKLAHAVVYIVTDAIGIVVRGAAATTFSDSISVVDAWTVVVIGIGIVVARGRVSASQALLTPKVPAPLNATVTFTSLDPSPSAKI